MSQASQSRIAPPEVRYIKLGGGGRWADVSLDRGDMRFGFSAVAHEVAQKGNADEIRAIFLAKEVCA